MFASRNGFPPTDVDDLPRQVAHTSPYTLAEGADDSYPVLVPENHTAGLPAAKVGPLLHAGFFA